MADRKQRERIRSADVARITGLSVRVVQQMAARGEIPPAATLGRVGTFREDAVRQWVLEAEDKNLRRDAAIAAFPKHPWAAPEPERRAVDEAYERLIGRKPRNVPRPAAWRR